MTQRSFVVSVESIAYTYRELYVGSRILSGTVAVGDTFTILANSSDPAATGVPVDLRVVQIATYRKTVTCIEAGVTCELKLAFEILPRLGPRDFLRGNSDAPLPELKVIGSADQTVPSV